MVRALSLPLLVLVSVHGLACSTAAPEGGADDGTADESSDEGYPTDPSRSFLTDADAKTVIDVANATALSSSVGEFSWRMTGLACGNAAGGCNAGLVVRPRASSGFDPVALAGVVGRVISGRENTPIAWRATFVRIVEDSSLEVSCELNAPYTARDQLLDASALAQEFEIHLLECVFAVERDVEGIVN